MNTDAVSSAGKTIVPAVEEKVVMEKEENLKPIWEKKSKPIEKRFTQADLWNIRKGARKFKWY